jgi:E3 SUMO-protein ligase PIAS1
MSVRETTRDSLRITVRIPDDVVSQMQRDPSKHRVMVFCSASNTGYSDISFPPQVDLKCNGEDVKANLRGLKNKPGSTRPADITQWLRRKSANLPNEVEIVWALTKQVRPRPLHS